MIKDIEVRRWQDQTRNSSRCLVSNTCSGTEAYLLPGVPEGAFLFLLRSQAGRLPTDVFSKKAEICFSKP